MVCSGRAYSNLMVCLVATNDELRHRAVSVLEMATSSLTHVCIVALDRCEGDLSTALVHLLSGRSPADSGAALAGGGSVRAALGMLG